MPSVPSTDFCALSDEVMLAILSYASPKELIRLRQTCQRLKNLVSESGIWERLLHKDFRLSRELFWSGWAAEDIYKAVYKFRDLLGLWSCEFSPFGLIILIKIEKDGIVAYDCTPPLDDSCTDLEENVNFIIVNPGVDYGNVQRLHHFRLRRLFALRPSTSEPFTSSSDSSIPSYILRFDCYHSQSLGVHPAQDAVYEVAPGSSQPMENGLADHDGSEVMDTEESNGCLQKTDTGFVFKCTRKEDHGLNDIRYWLEWEHGFRLKDDDESSLTTVLSNLRDYKDYDLRLEKLEAKASMDTYRLLRRIDHLLSPSLPTDLSRASPGLYFGHFSWHGWEVLNLFYANEGWRLMGEKVTGDQMIPAGRTSFRVDLRRRIHLSLEDQSSIPTVRAAVRRLSVESVPLAAANGHSPDSPVVHPFRVPTDCNILGAHSAPDHCTAFYMGEGQIAFPNFCNPRYLSCVFVVFSQVQIGLLWLDLRCFMPMYKIVDPCS